MKSSKLISLLLLLQSRGRMTAGELAAELEVSERTIYRYVEALQYASIPIYSERGPDGGYQLVDGYRTRLTGLTADEAESLFLAGIPGPAAELGLGTVVAAAELKVLAALPPELRSRATRLHERFHLDAPEWFQGMEDVPHLPAVASAVWEDRRIKVRYLRWKGETTRTLDPLGLVLKAGLWYLVARSREGIRLYRISRIQSITILDQLFERDPDFDLATTWSFSAQDFEDTVFTHQAQVRLSPLGFEKLELLASGPVAKVVRSSAGPLDDHGWRSATLPLISNTEGVMEILQFGPDIVVEGPAALRRLVAQRVLAMADLYA
jgi:predicted DNA-binding transcriptional regulator YafY